MPRLVLSKHASASILIVLSFAIPIRSAEAGAWTLPAGDTQIISGVILSDASASFGDSGGTIPLYYRKILLQSYAEHGLTDDLTLVLSPQYAIATEQVPGHPLIHANDFAIQGGLRYRITDAFGILSMQGTYKSAGAFDMSVSANNDSGSEIELRLLYGLNFKLFGRDAYFDAEMAQRWIGGARPNETPIDLTLGLHWSDKLTFMVQNFNIVAAGNGDPPYRYYRSHKLEFATVQRLWKGVYLESGVYFSPTGQNALVEHGADASIWVYF